MTDRIDAHLHYWRIDRGDYGWLTPALGPLYRDHLPHDAEPHLSAAGIEGLVLVQAAPTEAETRFLLDIGKTDRRVRGVVGWVDMTARDAPDRLAALAADPLLKAIRPMWQDLPDDGFMHRPEIQPVYRAMVDLGLRFDALAKPRHLPLMPRLLDRHPDLALIVDHGAKPDIAGGGLAAWRRDLAEVARRPRVFCKLSGLVTEGAAGVTADALRPYVETLIELFGPERLVFGSDWPVCTLRCAYGEWHAMARALTDTLGAAAQAAIFGGNAKRFYGLGPASPDAAATRAPSPSSLDQ